MLAGHQWLVPGILATWEAEVRRLTVWGQPGQIVHETPMQSTSMDWRYGSSGRAPALSGKPWVQSPVQNGTVSDAVVCMKTMVSFPLYQISASISSQSCCEWWEHLKATHPLSEFQIDNAKSLTMSVPRKPTSCINETLCLLAKISQFLPKCSPYLSTVCASTSVKSTFSVSIHM
jgi:hypothetical protein